MKLVQSEKPVTTTHAHFGELTVMVEVQQGESVADLVNFHGGEENLVSFDNSAIETSSRNVARAYLRNLPKDADLEVALAKARSLAAQWSSRGEGEGGTRTTNKKKAVKLDELKAMVASGKKLSPEELAEFLEGI